MKIVIRGLARALPMRVVLIAACVIGLVGAAYAQSGNSGAGNTGLSATPSSGNLQGGAPVVPAQRTGAGATGTAPGPTPGLATPGGSAGTGRTGSASPAPQLNNMRANGTSLNQNPDPRLPNLSGRPPSSR
ncbi:hypothetical protein VOM14_11470 [Paraburkholderia sp. MPAMCS5]|uniref:hypothetical protein n=1 Tax=Paraburkholderia sp. MPAMCS5 TaxID=3112563 RepID=UPI002E187BF2|nr:hypothetical protein [Paraburkholderia sp. MPAMCS5]